MVRLILAIFDASLLYHLLIMPYKYKLCISNKEKKNLALKFNKLHYISKYIEI